MNNDNTTGNLIILYLCLIALLGCIIYYCRKCIYNIYLYKNNTTPITYNSNIEIKNNSI